MLRADRPVSPIDRVRAIEALRFRTMLRATVGLVGSVMALVLSFFLGHSLGPTPVVLTEAAGAVGVAVLLAVLGARPIGRWRWDASAEARWWVFEGPRRRRARLFAEHVEIDDEVVLLDRVDRAERIEAKLVLRYQDPVAGGPLLREFDGPSRTLDALADALLGARAAPEIAVEGPEPAR